MRLQVITQWQVSPDDLRRWSWRAWYETCAAAAAYHAMQDDQMRRRRQEAR